VGIEDPTPGVPYMLAEAVGQFNYAARKGFDIKYRRAGDSEMLRQQALRHAQAHSKAATKPHICGVIAWCGFDYASLVNPYNNVKCPGVADSFRIPKLGAAFYLTQGDPKIRPVIAPDFFWDFGPQTPRGPGKQAAIFSNCERIELFIDGRPHAALAPDGKNYPHLKHPPFFADLELDGAGHPELRIDGFIGDRVVVSRSFSSDAGRDQFAVQADDAELIGNGSDATRLAFKVVDRFGAERAYGEGTVEFQISGPGEIVGDNPFALAPTGGVGAVWIRTAQNSAGTITVTARHSRFGEKSVAIAVKREPSI
jgi:beta-galactosidase